MRINVHLRYFTLLFIGTVLSGLQLSAQTFIGVSSTPADNGAQPGPGPVAVAPPAGTAAGDLVIIYAHYRSSFGSISLSMSALGGQTWTNETTDKGNSQTFNVFWCRFNGTWSGNPSVAVSSGSNALTVVMYVFRPTSATKFWGVHVAAANSSSSATTNTITGYATTVPNTVTMAFWCNTSSTGATWTGLNGAGWSKTGLSAQYRNTSGTDQSNTSAYNIQSAAAIISDVSQTQAAGTSTRRSILTWYEIPNDECAGAINLYSNSTCINTHATLIGATPSASIPLGCAAAGTYYDTWFSFDAANATETVTLSNVTSISNPTVQLYSGSCGALSSVACGTTSLTASGLSIGARYYVRVSNFSAASSGTFDICVTHQAPTSSTFDYGKSYVNISKNSGGGTINPGDTLEVRGTLVIRGGSGLDSLSFLDTLHLAGGVSLVPGSISLRTNEGIVYKSFTDAASDDEGYYYTSGTDTVIRINFGTGASATARGSLLNTSKPSVFGSTCIIMATYRVVVYAGYGTTLGLGGGKITARDKGTGTLSDLSFSARNAIVYSSPGLCPNAVAATNAIGGDNNGTFGSGTTQNRAPSPNVTGYTYSTFQTSNPQDYYYGIANNTSTGGSSFTTVTTWAKPDNSSPEHRVFKLWDITGDHTGATNTAKGNLPCDPSQPISPTNPCGYMLIVNSAYKTDTAFQYTVSNLCTNTYYEISAWMKNICYKCGCDSNGVASTGAGYIPSGLNDSSGVQPNITFDINGVDYYTTGNITYGGLGTSTQTGSDSNNTWVKRGFTYLTGAAQTSLTLTIRNNAPGGGGNDWAMDDISLATCLPSMSYSPSINPNVCESNPITINDTISSYFTNYTNYKWQRSTNGGSSWSDVTGVTSLSPTNSYITSYTVPPANTTQADSADLYRVVVATTVSNLSDPNCNISDGTTITLNVLDCNPVLDVNLLNFNGRLINDYASLNWVTTKEEGQYVFIIEKSTDQQNFVQIGQVSSNNNNTTETNYYSFTDPSVLTGKAWYRLLMQKTTGGKKYSRTILLNNNVPTFGFGNVINPFNSNLYFDINSNRNAKIDAILVDLSGKPVLRQSFLVYTGTNSLAIEKTGALPQGVYILRIENNGTFLNKQVVKRN